MSALLERLKEIQQKRFQAQTKPEFQKAWNFPLLKGELIKDGWLFPQVRRLGIIEALTEKRLLSRLFGRR